MCDGFFSGFRYPLFFWVDSLYLLLDLSIGSFLSFHYTLFPFFHPHSQFLLASISFILSSFPVLHPYSRVVCIHGKFPDSVARVALV